MNDLQKDCYLQIKSFPTARRKDSELSVLVLDDEPVIRKLASLVLRKHGCAVITAEYAWQAYTICLLRQSAIDLIITNVVLPDMKGPELISFLRTIRDDFEVIYLSGYLNRLRFKLREESFLYKPFTVHELLQKVEAAMSKKHRNAVPASPRR